MSFVVFLSPSNQCWDSAGTVLGQCFKTGHRRFIPDNLKYPTTNLLFDALSKQIDSVDK
jgi:hypothetical protein